MRKLSLSGAKWVRELIHASVKTSCEQRFVLRVCCVLLIAGGRSCYEVARWFGEDPRSIERWVHALDEHEVEGLPAHPAGGRPAKLAGEQAQCVALDLQMLRLSEYTKREWSGRLLTQHLEGSYGVKLNARQCQRMLRRLSRTGSRPG